MYFYMLIYYCVPLKLKGYCIIKHAKIQKRILTTAYPYLAQFHCESVPLKLKVIVLSFMINTKEKMQLLLIHIQPNSTVKL